MYAYQVNDMTCGHCVRAITQAVQALDGAARVEADLAQHLVRVESAVASAAAVQQAIGEAGYDATPVVVAGAAAAEPRSGGCGCGSGGGRCGG